ncbi:unnamed protein product [Darwinula stevensoni]|uniref:Sulfhydryl oxidase n=1 Tax=Darwinula stevensoni TaxID=69355 RepID=A0A7R9AD42_9CRUS|nr:unnamed protein product [Darwinula stevensoni]CAG0900957.1 unnamed protein product [Darwinula stevensoni]
MEVRQCIFFGFLLSIPLSSFGLSSLHKGNIGQNGLYDENDPLTIFTTVNLSDSLGASSTAWIIQFYNTWCGHCQAFASIWKQFANEVQSWHKFIRVGVVDCANEVNLHLCREFDVKLYPTIKMFPPRLQGTQGTIVLDKTPESMKAEVINFVTQLQQSQQLFNSMHLVAYMGPTLPAVRQNAVLIVDSESELGLFPRQILLALSSYEVIDGYWTTIRNVALMEVLGSPTQLPGVFIRDESQNWKQLKLTSLSLQEVIKSILASNLTTSKIGDMASNSFPSKIMAVHMVDMENGISYALRHEASSHKVISADDLLSLEVFVRTLGRYFPGRKEVRQYLSELGEWIQKHDDALDGETLESYLAEKQHADTFLPYHTDYKACKGSMPRYRGYPCSLWTLFHTLTVSATVNDTGGNGKEVLGAILGYIKHFFSCRECSENFQKMAQESLHMVSSGDEGVIWLWRAHNVANKWLSGAVSEDPQHPKVQFPPKTICPECYTPNGMWDEGHVLTFLKHFYGPESIAHDVQLKGQMVGTVSAPIHIDDVRFTGRKKYICGHMLDGDEPPEEEDDNVNKHKRYHGRMVDVPGCSY